MYYYDNSLSYLAFSYWKVEMYYYDYSLSFLPSVIEKSTNALLLQHT